MFIASLYRKHLSYTCDSQKGFTFNLGTGLLQGISNPYFQNAMLLDNTTTSDADNTQGSANHNNEEDFALQFDQDQSTLCE